MTNPVLYESSTWNDERILCDVMRQIVWQADIASSGIRVEVQDGIVRLRGAVETCMEKIEAENATKAACGVIRVVNNLVVNPDCPHADREIALEVLSALHNSNSVLEEFPKVIVRDGVATLYGRCRWDFQRSCAERVALSISGVKRVVNSISVDSWVKMQPAGVAAADPHAVSERAESNRRSA